MLRVVAFCAVALVCHLIVAANSDIKVNNNLINETSSEELGIIQGEIEPGADDKDENHEEENFCSQPPDIDGVISPVLEAEVHPVGTIISYQCKFGYVSRSSGILLSICRVDKLSGKAEWTHPNTTCIPRSCGDPGYVVNGRRIGNLFTFPNNVKFECLVGYKLQGLKDRYCQANGEWSGRLPTCVLIRCPVPTNPVNGRVRYISLDYGSELEYECDKGFMLQNRQPRICSEGGRWSNSSPVCIEITCEIPEAPDHGSVQLSGEPKVGTLALYSCNDDTTLVGASTSKCLKTGEWTFNTPKCLRSCFVSSVQDGEIGRYQRRNRYRQDFVSLGIGERIKHNEIVTFRCKEGYSPGNVTNGASVEVTCNDGTWSELLHCHPILCTGEPPPIKNGTPKIGSRAHGKGIWYECDPGYHRTKRGQIVCRYGKWEGYTPVCEDYRCHTKDLNYPGLVKPLRNFLHHGRNFTIVCDEPFTLSWSKKEAFCIEGKWDITQNPCTIKTCEKEPPALNNGKVRDFARTNGSIVDYECLKDYEMVGNSSVYCAFGEWEGQPPVCKPSVNNLATSRAKQYEANRDVTEAFNHTLNPSHSEECFCTYDHRKDFLVVYWGNSEIDGHYKIKKGQKVLLACRHYNMDIVWPSGLRFFEKVELTCDVCQDWQGYDLPECETRVAGDSFILHDDQLKLAPGGIIEVPKGERVSLTCINPWLTPIWNVTFTETLRFNESLPPVIQTGFFMKNIIIDAMDYEHIGRYECFAMHGNQKQRPVVVSLKISGFEILCPELSTETNLGSFEIFYSNERYVHSTAHYSCKDPQKRILGPSERTCLENGRWSLPYPACADILCPLLNDNIFRITYSNNGKINSIAFYDCKNTHQRLIGSSNRTCLHSGEWSGTNPVCEDVSCPEFPKYNGLSVRYSNGRKVGSVASFNCLNHATLIGNTSSTCLRNGMWSHPKPSCEMLEIRCPKIDGKGIFTIKYTNGRSVNSTAQFFCKELNKKVAGCNFVTCQQNGEWSGDYPTCVDFASCDLFATPPNLNVFYTDDGQVGSIASFQCSPPTILVGNSSSRCLSNSSWSHSLPTCAAPNCSIEDLEMSLPFAVHPNMMNVTSEFVTPGSEIPLICEDYLVITGSSTALCNFLGKWEIADVQCISACLVNKDESSHLIVEPVKDYYRIGEFVLLSCPPGQTLTSDVERIMCLGKAWSDPLPDCILSTLTKSNVSGSS